MAFRKNISSADVAADDIAFLARKREEKSPETVTAATFTRLLLLHGLPHEGFTLDMVDVATGEPTRIATTYWSDAERAAFLESPQLAAAFEGEPGHLTLTLRGGRVEVRTARGRAPAFEAHFAEFA